MSFCSICQKDARVLSHANSGDVHHFGVCLGLLTACVAATAKGTEELSRLGADVVAVAFRLGLACQRRSRHIEDSSRSWARTFFGVEAGELQKSIDLVNSVSAVHGHSCSPECANISYRNCHRSHMPLSV